jgi:hypothetical protein
MNKTTRAIFLMLVVVSAVFVFAIVSMQSSTAYHSLYPTKKECVQFFKETIGNTTRDSNITCQKIIPH